MKTQTRKRAGSDYITTMAIMTMTDIIAGALELPRSDRSYRFRN